MEALGYRKERISVTTTHRGGKREMISLTTSNMCGKRMMVLETTSHMGGKGPHTGLRNGSDAPDGRKNIGASAWTPYKGGKKEGGSHLAICGPENGVSEWPRFQTIDHVINDHAIL